MKDTDFIYIPGWAVNRLELKGNSLMVYSIIFSYSRDGVQWYQAPAEYLASCIGASESTVKDILKKLTDSGLLRKKVVKYVGSVNRVFYQAIVPEICETDEEPFIKNKPENSTYSVANSILNKTSTETVQAEEVVPVPKRYKTSTETVLNNNNNNNSIINTPKGVSSRRSLFKTEDKSVQAKRAKIEKFVFDCHRISEEYEFTGKVSDKLVDFFRMLGQSDSFLPEITIRAQLSDLIALSEQQQLDAISDTLKSGWKSLKYAIEAVKKTNAPSFDTAKPGAFQPKDPKNDRRWEDYEDDEVF